MVDEDETSERTLESLGRSETDGRVSVDEEDGEKGGGESGVRSTCGGGGEATGVVGVVGSFASCCSILMSLTLVTASPYSTSSSESESLLLSPCSAASTSASINSNPLPPSPSSASNQTEPSSPPILPTVDSDNGLICRLKLAWLLTLRGLGLGVEEKRSMPDPVVRSPSWVEGVGVWEPVRCPWVDKEAAPDR